MYCVAFVRPSGLSFVLLFCCLMTPHSRRPFYVQDCELVSLSLGVRHFGTETHTAANILEFTKGVVEEYGVADLNDIPVVTDCGSNVRAAFSAGVRFDCLEHRSDSDLFQFAVAASVFGMAGILTLLTF